MQIFKYQGHEFKPERLTARQVAAGLIHHLFGIETALYRTTRTARANDWNRHADRLQKELDTERAAGLILSGLND